MTNETTTPAKGKKPTHTCYHVREGQQDKSYWTRIGVAWQHADSQGFNVQLELVPLDGRVAVRLNTEKPQ